MSVTRPIYVFDHVRSNSQLFNKLFASHPQLEQVFMPMIAASLYGPDAVFRGRRHSETTEQAFQGLANASGVAESESVEVAVERIEAAVAGILEKGKIPWLKDHAFCVMSRSVQDAWAASAPLPDSVKLNPSILSTQFLDRVTSVFLIRHPALSIPSFLRKNITICKNQAEDEDFPIYTALFWSRLLFDSFTLRSQAHITDGTAPCPDKGPIVIDAADVIYNTVPILTALCHQLGIDFSGVQLSWDPLPEEQWPADDILKTFFSDMFLSKGVERRADKPSEEDLDLEALQREWDEEFGPWSAGTLRKLVDDEVRHYKYLKRFKLQA